MPIFHNKLSGKGQAPDGSQVDLPPKVALALRGPVVQVTVTVAEAVAEQLLAQGAEVPDPIAGLALVDTGASNTCVDDDVAQNLGLAPIDQVTIASASHANQLQNVYPVLIEFVGTPVRINALRAIGANIAVQDLIALIGRDLLQETTLHYNGIDGSFTISI